MAAYRETPQCHIRNPPATSWPQSLGMDAAVAAAAGPSVFSLPTMDSWSLVLVLAALPYAAAAAAAAGVFLPQTPVGPF